MLRNLITCLAVVSLTTCFSQEVIATQGDTYANSSGEIQYTIGEVVINTVSDGTNDLTQGFHQTNWNFVGLDDHMPEIEVSVYPNPLTDKLIVRTSLFENTSYTLLDANGKVIRTDKLINDETSIESSDLAPGAYQLVLKDKNQSIVKLFKLIKNH